LVVVGAAGDLARAVLAQCGSYRDRYLFDQRDDSPAVAHCDVAVPGDVERALDALPIEATQHWRMLSVVGSFNGRAEWAGDWHALRASIEINLTGVAHFAGGLAHRLAVAGATGRLVIVGSAASRVGSRDIGYGAAKAGLVGLVRSLSKVFAARGVTTVGVEPGIIDTAMSRQQDPIRRAAAIGQNDAVRPFGVVEVAEIIRYALCAAPNALSGSMIEVGGGPSRPR